MNFRALTSPCRTLYVVELAIFCSLPAASAWAAPRERVLGQLNSQASVSAPILTVGASSGIAGTEVNVPVGVDPGTASIASLQFSLNLPMSLSTGSFTPGAILTAAGKTVTANLAGSTWTFIIFGLNRSSIAGNLLAVRLKIAPGVAAGTLDVPVTRVVYSDGNGISIPAGRSKGGNVTVAEKRRR